MDRRLYIEYLGDSIELGLGETLVGRDLGCTLRFNDPLVSRRHLRFVHRADDIFVEDIGSSNGTQINGRQLRGAMRINDGDTIVVGSRTLTIRVSEGEDYQQASTLLLRDGMIDLESVQPMPLNVVTSRFAGLRVDESAARAPTSQFALVSDPDEPRRITSAPTIPPFPAATSAPPAPPFTSIPIERRRHDRIPVELRLVYVSDELEIEANTLDLSQSGVFVCTQILDPVGTMCELTILIDGGPALKVKGIVRRVVVQGNDRGEPPGFGVEFLELGDKERSWIDIAAVRITS